MIPGYATSDPLKLCLCIRERYLALIEACLRQGVRLVPIETFRDIIRQRYYVAHKVSKTLKSKHLPQPPFGLSLAVDAAPKRVLELKGWAPGHQDWLVYTEEARRLRLECGADWAGFNKGWDWPHVQLPECQCPQNPIGAFKCINPPTTTSTSRPILMIPSKVSSTSSSYELCIMDA